ncbi:response regulator [Cochlodiniinecator piscidefendens]|uniref:response regulator n=1 Tax=Cochlodiniinecator piscidefendens TaxID=2715756 RepID=UPI001408FBC0|nr:response regulator [Cochlodiniinecator piscidefendens]
MDGTVLVADDDRTIRTVLTQALTRAGAKVHATGSMATLMRWVEEGRGDLVISDVVMPDGNGLEALPKITTLRPSLPVIIISAQNTITTAIRAEAGDAFDYLPKPFDLPELMTRCSKGLQQKQTLQAPSPAVHSEFVAETQDLPLVGSSKEMQALYRLVARIMNADLPVLVGGESGTGKTLVAQAIHEFSERRAAPLSRVGPDDFSDSVSGQGLLEKAGNGSLLFDEVGAFNLEAQARLVRFIDGIPANGPRIIATSQANLINCLSEGSFRDDLYYRLSGVVIDIPPLRDRVEDISLLSQHFLERGAAEGLAERSLSDDAIGALVQFAWPGNVRQLENVMRRLLVTSAENTITSEDVQTLIGIVSPTEAVQFAPQNERLSQSVERHLKRYFDLHGDEIPPSGLYQRVLREVELPLIELAMDSVGGNQAKCADLLGINRNTLRKKLTELDIRVTRRRKLM